MWNSRLDLCFPSERIPEDIRKVLDNGIGILLGSHTSYMLDGTWTSRCS